MGMGIKKRARKRKPIPVHSDSLLELADQCEDQALGASVELMTPGDLFQTLGKLLRREGLRLRGIVK